MDIFIATLMAKTFNISNWVWLLLGFLLSSILNQAPKSIKVLSGKRLEWLFLSFNFVLLLWNAAFTTRIAQIAAKSNEMSNIDLANLGGLADIFFVLAIIGMGFLIGEFVFAMIQGLFQNSLCNFQESSHGQ